MPALAPFAGMAAAACAGAGVFGGTGILVGAEPCAGAVEATGSAVSGALERRLKGFLKKLTIATGVALFRLQNSGPLLCL